MTRALDLGCGEKPRNDYKAGEVYGIDIIEQKGNNISTVDLACSPIPFPDEFFDFVTAYDFLEHIPRHGFIDGRSVMPFLALMDEIFRVLRQGGVFFSDTPAFPEDMTKEGATRDLHLCFADPTHVNVISLYTFPFYFCEPHCWAKQYGFKGRFELVSQEFRGMNLMSTIKKSST